MGRDACTWVCSSEGSECWWSVLVRSCSDQAGHIDICKPFSACSFSVKAAPLVCLDSPQPRYSLVVFAPCTPHIHIIALPYHLHVHVYKWHDIAFLCVCECALCHAQFPGLSTAHCTWHWPTASSSQETSTQCKYLSAHDHTECAHAPCLFKEDFSNSLFVPQPALCSV